MRVLSPPKEAIINPNTTKQTGQHSTTAHTKNELYVSVTAASEVEAIVRFPTNMAAAKIDAVDFNKMTSK